MSNYKEIVARQLIALGNAFPSFGDEDLCTGVLDACSGLVGLLSENIDSKALPQEFVGDFTSCLDGLQLQINKLAAVVAGADCLKVGSEAVDQLGELQRKMQDLQAREKMATTQLPAMEQAVQKLEPIVTQLEKDYAIQEKLHEALKEKQGRYSDANRKMLEAENDKLLDQIAAVSKEFKRLHELKQNYATKMAALQANINGMPTEQKLVDAYDAKVAELERLKRAEVECSLAKQSELENQISDLKKDVEGLEEAMEKLRERKQETLNAKTERETEKGIFETEFIGKLQAAMDDLKNNMSAHKQALNRLKDDADLLNESIAECNNIRLNYSFMFDSLNDPLIAIAKATELDHETLKKYLDVNMSNRIEELKGNIKQDLTQLGTIIDQCREAASTDQARLLYKVTQAK